LRVHRSNQFSFAATNLTGVYRAVRPQNDNPAVASIVREYLFIRPMETLLVFDRLASNSVGGTPAASITKTFLAHFENSPQITSSTSALGVNGSNALRLITLVPANPAYRVVNEANGGSASVAQYRLEVETSGQAQSHFLHVLQARDASGPDISASVQETASSFQVNLSHPSSGTATLVFNKGMTSSGGSVSINGGPAVTLLNRVQGLQITANGPQWEDVGDGGGASPPARPTGLRIVP
jgi:hypothetical protein